MMALVAALAAACGPSGTVATPAAEPAQALAQAPPTATGPDATGPTATGPTAAGPDAADTAAAGPAQERDAGSVDPGAVDPGAVDPGAVDAALAQLAALPVKGRAPKTGYSRDHFGPAWTDAVAVEGGRNGCDTRNDILRRDLTALTFKPGSGNCTVLTGVLADPYTGTSIEFQRGASTSMEVQIDHVVALSDAWQKGAQQLDAATRQDLANDPRNLQAAQGKANQQKSDGDAATWLPPNKSYRCTYVARQVEVKAAYGLWVTAPERDAVERVLRTCGAGGAAAPPPPDVPDPDPAPAETPSAPADLVFANCAAARAAGAAPLHAGQPGYRPQMDGDKDGIACE